MYARSLRSSQWKQLIPQGYLRRWMVDKLMSVLRVRMYLMRLSSMQDANDWEFKSEWILSFSTDGILGCIYRALCTSASDSMRERCYCCSAWLHWCLSSWPRRCLWLSNRRSWRCAMHRLFPSRKLSMDCHGVLQWQTNFSRACHPRMCATDWQSFSMLASVPLR